MSVSKSSTSNSTDILKLEGSDVVDTWFKQSIVNDPLISLMKASDRPIQWIRFHQALDQPDLPGWPLLSPVKVQLHKCDKCSRKFFSSINCRRHIRVHHRLKKLDKDTGKSRELLGSFWNKLSAEEKKEIVSFKDLTFEMGRGRTTTGTVIACLLKLQIEHGRPIRVLVDDIVQGEEMDEGSSDGKENGINNAPISCLVKENKIEEQTRAFGINGLLLLWKITNIFENGVQCREVLDTIIDRCSALQNIRQAVLQYRKVFNQQHVEPRVRQLALNCGAEYLDRYFRLIAFAAYLGSEAFDGLCGQGLTKMSFKSWLHQRPELQAMKWSVRLWPGRFFTVSNIGGVEGARGVTAWECCDGSNCYHT